MSVRRYDTIALGLLKKEEEEEEEEELEDEEEEELEDEEECQIEIFYFARCARKLALYSDVIYLFNWKSAVEHDGGV